MRSADSDLNDEAKSVGLRAPVRDAASQGFVRLAGQVVEAGNKKPIAGAAIYLKLQSRHVERQFEDEVDEATLKSAKDGTFEFGKLTPGVWLCVIWHPSYTPPGASGVLASLANLTGLGRSPFMLDVPPRARGVIKKTYEMSRGRVIHGRVIDANGESISDVAIRIRLPESLADDLPYGMASTLNQITAACPPKIAKDGAFTLGCIPAGIRGIRIAAYKKGCACKYEYVDGDQEVVLRVLPCASIEGRVTDFDGNAASDAFVGLWSEEGTSVDNWAYEEVRDTKTKKDGTYSLIGLPPTDCLVSAGWQESYWETSRWVEAIRPSETRSDIELAIGTPPRHIRACVLGPDGEPRPNAFVSVRSKATDQRDAGGDDRFDEDIEGVTQASGHVDFFTRLPEPLEFVHRTRNAVHVLKLTGTSSDGELRLVTPATMHNIDIHVRTKSGAAMRSFEAHIDQTGESDEFLVTVNGRNGKASARRYEKPPFTIRVHHAVGGDGSLYKPEARVADAKNLLKPLEFVLSPSGPRCIKILDSSGQPLPGVDVSIHTRRWNATPNTTVSSIQPNSDRAFPVPIPDETFYSDSTLVISLPAGFVPVRARYDKRSYYEPIVPMRAGEIGGRVIFPDSLSLPRPLSLEARWDWKQSDPPWLDYKVEIPVDERTGAFRSHKVPLDRPIELFPKHAALMKLRLVTPPTISVRAGKTNIELPLSSGLTIQGKVTVSGASGPMHVVAIPTRGHYTNKFAKVRRNGTFVLEGVSPVPHRVILYSTDGSGIKYDEAIVPVGKNVHFDIGRLDVLEIHGTVHNGKDVWIWESSSTRVLANLYESSEIDAQVAAALPTRLRYDVVLVADNSIGYKLGVKAGDSIRMSTSPAVFVAGEVDREPSKDDRLVFIPTGRGPKFLCYFKGTSFVTPVLPGQYDIAYQPRAGTLTTIAKDVSAGGRGLMLQLPTRKSKAK